MVLLSLVGLSCLHFNCRFDPSRWEHPSQEMKDAFMPFGAGARSMSHLCSFVHESILTAGSLHRLTSGHDGTLSRNLLFLQAVRRREVGSIDD